MRRGVWIAERRILGAWVPMFVAGEHVGDEQMAKRFIRTLEPGIWRVTLYVPAAKDKAGKGRRK